MKIVYDWSKTKWEVAAKGIMFPDPHYFVLICDEYASQRRVDIQSRDQLKKLMAFLDEIEEENKQL